MNEANKNLITRSGSKLSERFAERFGVDTASLMDSLKATAFKQRDGSPDVSNSQMVALLIVAEQYGLNPFTKEIYAFPSSTGIIPVVGVDGWNRIINENEHTDGIEFNESVDMVELENGKRCPEWIECIIYRKDRSKPVKVKEYIDECYREAIKRNGKNGQYEITGPWQSHPKRMLRHKALIQCGRVAFGFGGIYDDDEAERIKDADVVSVQTIKKPRVTKPQAIEKPKKEKPQTELEAEEQNEPQQISEEQFKDVVSGIIAELKNKNIDSNAIALQLVKKGFSGDPMDAAENERSRVVDVLQSMI